MSKNNLASNNNHGQSLRQSTTKVEMNIVKTYAKEDSLTNSKGIIPPKKWFEDLNLREITLVIRALNHKMRKLIIYLLAQNRNESLTLNYISNKLNIEPVILEQHIQILYRVGIVELEKINNSINYSLNKKIVTELEELLKLESQNN